MQAVKKHLCCHRSEVDCWSRFLEISKNRPRARPVWKDTLGRILELDLYDHNRLELHRYRFRFDNVQLENGSPLLYACTCRGSSNSNLWILTLPKRRTRPWKLYPKPESLIEKILQLPFLVARRHFRCHQIQEQ